MSKFSRFAPPSGQAAYLKAGFLGLPGSGKTYTAAALARGLILDLRSRGDNTGNLPVYFADTETGSAYVQHDFASVGIDLQIANTRAFCDLLPMITDAEQNASVLIIDSITHFWIELCDSYLAKIQQKYKHRVKLEFQDWAHLKPMWRSFSDAFINANVHIILCGRAGYEYSHETDDRGKKQLVKGNVKLKAESEFGYEPSLLVELIREDDGERNSRVARIMKDRFNVIDGQSFLFPNNRDTLANTRMVYKAFKPYIDRLGIGQDNAIVDTTSSTADMLPDGIDGPDATLEQQRIIVLDELKELLTKHYPGGFGEDKQRKSDMLERAFGTRSWEKIKTLDLDTVRAGFLSVEADIRKALHKPTARAGTQHREAIRDSSGTRVACEKGEDGEGHLENSQSPKPNSEFQIPNSKFENEKSMEDDESDERRDAGGDEGKEKNENEKLNLKNKNPKAVNRQGRTAEEVKRSEQVMLGEAVKNVNETFGVDRKTYYWPDNCQEYLADKKRLVKAKAYAEQLLLEGALVETAIIGMYEAERPIKKLAACECSALGVMLRGNNETK